MKTFVITGPSSSGKSTLIEFLQNKGFYVVPEIARSVLEEGVFHPSRDPYLFQKEIAKRQATAEEKMKSLDIPIAFLDRGFHDQIAYCKHSGITEFPPEIQIHSEYTGVFNLEMLNKFESDGIRIEKGGEEARQIHKVALDEYKKCGIPVISIPAISVSDRAKLIIEYSLKLPSSAVSDIL